MPVQCLVITHTQPRQEQDCPIDIIMVRDLILIMTLDKFAPKFDLLPKSLQEEMIEYAEVNGIYRAGSHYCDRARMTRSGLSSRLRRELARKHKPTVQKIYGGGKVEKKAKRLSPQEKQFLKDLAAGKVGIEEASRLIAVRVFEKMLKYPDQFKFYDFYQSQLLKIKEKEAEDKQTRAMELINRLFSGKLPPPNCPKCGTELYKPIQMESNKIIEGEVVKK